MHKISRILKDHTEAGTLNSLLAVWGFVDNHTFITKSGDIGLVYRLAGVDYEGCDHDKRASVAHSFEAAIRLLDDRYRVYQYLIKRRVDEFPDGVCVNPIAAEAIHRRVRDFNSRRDELYVIDLYLVVMTNGLKTQGKHTTLKNLFKKPKQAVKEWLNGATAITVLEEEINIATKRLHQKLSTFQIQLSDTVKPTRLTKTEVYQFLGKLVNYAPQACAPLVYDTHVDFFVANSHVECDRDHLTVGSKYVKVLTMKDPPSHTFAHILQDLYSVPGEFISCLEWKRIAESEMRSKIQTRRRHFFNRRVSAINYLQSTEVRPEEMLIDTSADAIVGQLGNALQQIEVHRHSFGECSLTMVFYDTNLDVVNRGVSEAIKVLSTYDGALVEETYNVMNAWLSIMPGNHVRNLRRLAILDSNYADMSFLFTLDRGAEYSNYLKRESMAVFETASQTPFSLELHVGDVGHTLILGATGSGKSFLLNFLLMQVQRYNPFTVVFDLGHSYRKLTNLLKGSYLELGVDKTTVQLNPFTLANTVENVHFLHAFVKVLIEGKDAPKLTVSEDRELYTAVQNMWVYDVSQRTLFTLANTLPTQLTDRLLKWTNPSHGLNDGRYGHMFDNVNDTLSLQHLQVFDFSAMEEYPALLEPLLFYILHRVSDVIRNTTGMTICVFDEAWKFIKNETIRDYVQDALKTWRKHNASMFIATQSVGDFIKSELLPTVMESCLTTMFLANPKINRQQYADTFHLNEMEMDSLVGLSQRQILLKRPKLTRTLLLNVDPATYWLYTNTPADNERLDKAIEVYGFPAALDQLAKEAA